MPVTWKASLGLHSLFYFKPGVFLIIITKVWGILKCLAALLQLFCKVQTDPPGLTQHIS